MNIHKSKLFWCELQGVQGFDTLPVYQRLPGICPTENTRGRPRQRLRCENCELRVAGTWRWPPALRWCSGSTTKALEIGRPHQQMGMGQNPIPIPLVNIKIAGKWMFIPLNMVLIGIDPYPNDLLGKSNATLVGGFNHLETYERQWEGWHPIYYGKTCSKPTRTWCNHRKNLGCCRLCIPTYGGYRSIGLRSCAYCGQPSCNPSRDSLPEVCILIH